VGGTRLSTTRDNENLEQDQGHENRNRPSAQQKGVLPRSLSLETASTPYGTFSNIQLDPIEKQYSAEDAAAYGSFSGGALQQLIPTTQEQVKRDMQRLVESHKSHKSISKSRKLNGSNVFQPIPRYTEGQHRPFNVSQHSMWSQRGQYGSKFPPSMPV